ncbi:hypothetical protein [Chamaesiphon minutus]|uniref:hypothetical protein n=1 Tax=Chamaesiphon minutus TaxID=1173032 RepID=UPI00059F2F48|nr:hypothetical protein [Chamaesiphon minutus]
MNQVITAKLKLNLTIEQKSAVRDTALAYRDALNHASKVAFDNGKASNGAKCHLQHKMAEKARLCFTERSTLGSKDRSGSSSQKEF